MYEPGLISVVVVNWNRRDLLRACLESLRAQTYRNLEVVVVDNTSCDNSLEYLKACSPGIKIIANKENLLYSYAQNQGIIQAKGEFILSLNNDVILDRDFLKEAITAMKTDENIGIVSGKILSGDKNFIDTAGQLLSRFRKPLERGYRQKDSGQFDKAGFIFGACGACALYRSRMLDEIRLQNAEYFDNDYGLFYEDLDLNWRANIFGWKAYYAPKAVGYHARGGSAKTGAPAIRFFRRFNFCCLSPSHQLMLLKNRYSTIIKNDTLRNFLRDFFFIFLYDFLIWLYLFLFRPSVIIGLLTDMRFLKTAYEKRKIIRGKIMKSI